MDTDRGGGGVAAPASFSIYTAQPFVTADLWKSLWINVTLKDMRKVSSAKRFRRATTMGDDLIHGRF